MCDASKRKKIVYRRPNALFEKWLEEWRDEAASKNSNLQHCYNKALKSLKKYPLPLKSGKECLILEYFGQNLCAKLDKRLTDYRKTHPDDGDENVLPTTSRAVFSVNNQPEHPKAAKKRKSNKVGQNDSSSPASTSKKPKLYVPSYRSGAYALLITLLKAYDKPTDIGWMTKAQLQSSAQILCDTSFVKPDPGSHYTAWSSMSTLIKKALVVRTGSPAKFSLTEEGKILAKQLESLDSSKEASYPSSTVAKESGLKCANDSYQKSLSRPNLDTQASTRRIHSFEHNTYDLSDIEDDPVACRFPTVSLKANSVPLKSKVSQLGSDRVQSFQINAYSLSDLEDDLGIPEISGKSKSSKSETSQSLSNRVSSFKSQAYDLSDLEDDPNIPEILGKSKASKFKARSISNRISPFKSQVHDLSIVEDDLVVSGISGKSNLPKSNPSQSICKRISPFKSQTYDISDLEDDPYFPGIPRTSKSDTSLSTSNKLSSFKSQTSDLTDLDDEPIISTVFPEAKSKSNASLSVFERKNSFKSRANDLSDLEDDPSVPGIVRKSNPLKSKTSQAISNRISSFKTHACDLPDLGNDSHAPEVSEMFSTAKSKLSKSKACEVVSNRKHSFEYEAYDLSDLEDDSGSSKVSDAPTVNSKPSNSTTALSISNKVSSFESKAYDLSLLDIDPSLPKVSDAASEIKLKSANSKDSQSVSEKIHSFESGAYRSSDFKGGCGVSKISDVVIERSSKPFASTKFPSHSRKAHSISDDEDDLNVNSSFNSNQNQFKRFSTDSYQSQSKEILCNLPVFEISDNDEDENDGDSNLVLTNIPYSKELRMKNKNFKSGTKSLELVKKDINLLSSAGSVFDSDPISESCKSLDSRRPCKLPIFEISDDEDDKFVRTIAPFHKRSKSKNENDEAEMKSSLCERKSLEVSNLCDNVFNDKSDSDHNKISDSDLRGDCVSPLEIPLEPPDFFDDDFNDCYEASYSKEMPHSDMNQAVSISSQDEPSISCSLNLKFTSSVKKSTVPDELFSEPSSCLSSTKFSVSVPSTANKISSASTQSSSQDLDTVILEPGTFDVALVVDNQETNNRFHKSFLQELEFHGTKFEVRHLKVGDYLWIARHKISDTEVVLPYIVERKRMDDLGKSIKDGRFHEQKIRLKNSCIPNLIYLVEKYGGHCGLPEKTVYQAAINTYIVDKFSLKFTSDLKQSALYLSSLTKILSKQFLDKTIVTCDKGALPKFKLDDDLVSLMTFKNFSHGIGKVRNDTVKDMFIKHLLQIRGMSVEKALAIVDKYPTPKSLLTAYETGGGQNLLASITFGPTKRCIGPTLSKIIHQLYTLDEFP